MFKALRSVAFPIHVRREAVTLTLLTGVAIVFFLFVTALTGMYEAQQGALATRWSERATQDLNAGNYKAAVDEFRTALRYSHGDFAQQLGLAEALIGMDRVSEAEAYLVNLWEQQPENGIVNRELARIAAGKGETRRALRYYHNAIYATWPDSGEKDRRETRWELIKYLLHLDAKAEAQSELIALNAEVGDDPAQRLLLGEYFLKVQDNPHALACFRMTLAADPRSARALAGAGQAAFEMADYGMAERYLRRALVDAPGDRASAALLETTEQVLHMDPLRGEISDAERVKAVTDAFAVAGARLQSCPAAGGTTGTGGAQQSFADAWNQMKPQVTERRLRGNPDLVNNAMDLVFAIERQANGKCGAGTPSDAALLLISKMHEGS